MSGKSIASTVVDSPRSAKRKRVSLAPTECSDRTVVYEGGAISSPKDYKLMNLLEANVAATMIKLNEKNHSNPTTACNNAKGEKSRLKKQMVETPRQEKLDKYAEEKRNKKRECTPKSTIPQPRTPLNDKQSSQAARTPRRGLTPINQGKLEGEENRMKADPMKNARKRERASTPPPAPRRTWRRNDLAITIPKTEVSSSCPPTKRSRENSIASTVVIPSPTANKPAPWNYDEVLAHCSNTADIVAEQLRNGTLITPEGKEKNLISSNNGGSTTTGSTTMRSTTVKNHVSPTSGASPSSQKIIEKDDVVIVDLTQERLQELNYSEEGSDDDHSIKKGDGPKKIPHMINRMKQEGQIATPRLDCSKPKGDVKEEVKDQVKEQDKRPKSLAKTLAPDSKYASTPKEQHKTMPCKVQDSKYASTQKEQHKSMPCEVRDLEDTSTPKDQQKTMRRKVQNSKYASTPKEQPKTMPCKVHDTKYASTPKEQHKSMPWKGFFHSEGTFQDSKCASTPKAQHKTTPCEVYDLEDTSTPPKVEHKTTPSEVHDLEDSSTPPKVWKKWVRHKSQSPRIITMIEID